MPWNLIFAFWFWSFETKTSRGIMCTLVRFTWQKYFNQLWLPFYIMMSLFQCNDFKWVFHCNSAHQGWHNSSVRLNCKAVSKNIYVVLSTDTSTNFDRVDEKIEGGGQFFSSSNCMKVDTRRILKDIESVSERPCRKSMEHMNDPELLLRHNSQPILWGKNHTYFGITEETDENSQIKSGPENHLITIFQN